ncbi:MAG: hypothetical protein AAFV93_06495 [Chloroflexota bacterium]
MSDEKKHFGLTQAEYDNLLQIIRYGVIIVVTVLITFTVIAGITRWFDYTPPANSATLTPTPSSSE